MSNIEKSKFTKETLVLEVKKRYNLDIIAIEKINRGSANIYKISTEKEDYILKEFQSKYDKNAIFKEINILNFLKEKKLKVPEYIQCLNKKYYFTYEDRIVIIQKFIEGNVLPKNVGNKEMILESAKYLGIIVKELENYPFDDIECCNLDNYNFLETSIESNEKLIQIAKKDKANGKKIIQDLEDKIEIIKELLDKNIMKDFNKLSIKKTHGDYSVLQFIYENNKIAAIIDFVTSLEMPIVWEIIRSYSYIDKEVVDGKFNIDNLVLYTKEYMKYSNLNEFDLKYMPYIYLAQILNSTFGYKQYLKNGNLELLEFGIERTKICKFLYENAKLISDKLLETL